MIAACMVSKRISILNDCIIFPQQTAIIDVYVQDIVPPYPARANVGMSANYSNELLCEIAHFQSDLTLSGDLRIQQAIEYMTFLNELMSYTLWKGSFCHYKCK